eukprot:4262783-Amphidinium_carterae.1
MHKAFTRCYARTALELQPFAPTRPPNGSDTHYCPNFAPIFSMFENTFYRIFDVPLLRRSDWLGYEQTQGIDLRHVIVFMTLRVSDFHLVVESVGGKNKENKRE